MVYKDSQLCQLQQLLCNSHTQQCQCLTTTIDKRCLMMIVNADNYNVTMCYTMMTKTMTWRQQFTTLDDNYAQPLSIPTTLYNENT